MGRIDLLNRSKNFFGKVFSLDSSYRIYIFLLVLLALFLIPISFLEASPNLSICSRIFGEYCYSVGITRGVSALMKGDFSLAWEYNPLAIFVLAVMLGIIFSDLVRKIRK